MKRNVRFAVTITLGALAFLPACGVTESDSIEHELQAQANSVITSGETLIRMDSVTDFDWDELFVFGPYTKPEQIQAAFGKPEPEIVLDRMQDSDKLLLVFRNGGKVVTYAVHSRHNGDMATILFGKPIKRNDALFKMTRAGGRDALIELQLQPAGSFQPADR